MGLDVFERPRDFPESQRRMVCVFSACSLLDIPLRTRGWVWPAIIVYLAAWTGYMIPLQFAASARGSLRFFVAAES